MPSIDLPGWVEERVPPAAAALGLMPLDLIRRTLHTQVSARVATAVEALLGELRHERNLVLRRRDLEAEQRDLLARLGKPGPAETETSLPTWTIEWSDAVVPEPPDLERAAVLATVYGQDEIPAAMALGSWRAVVHYRCYELAYDNQVVDFHNAGLRTRAGAGPDRSR
jgi:hypothetical protein